MIVDGRDVFGVLVLSRCYCTQHNIADRLAHTQAPAPHISAAMHSNSTIQCGAEAQVARRSSFQTVYLIFNHSKMLSMWRWQTWARIVDAMMTLVWRTIRDIRVLGRSIRVDGGACSVFCIVCMDVAKDERFDDDEWRSHGDDGDRGTGRERERERPGWNGYRTAWIDGDEDLLQLTGWVDFKGYSRWPFDAVVAALVSHKRYEMVHNNHVIIVNGEIDWHECWLMRCQL